MLTSEEEKFVTYWAQNRIKKKKSVWQYSIGLPLGVLVIVALFANIVTGWHKRAAAVLQSNSSLVLVIVVAAVLIVVFVTLFSVRYKWEQHEQKYQELLLKQKRGAA